MSGDGSPRLTVTGAGLHVGIIAAQWHAQVMDGLVTGAERACRGADATATVFRVPGAFELPLAAQAAAATNRFDALVALGVVIRGGTPHFDYVCLAATTGLEAVARSASIPIGFGLLTCDDEQQALDRAGLPQSGSDKGAEAVEAALALALTLRDIGAAPQP
jgi:6,7-dimethyl-8-ribityllumazine synthase